jgi:putative phage-type endonuclease
MGLLQFYYDRIIFEQFNLSKERDFLLKEWKPEEKPIEETDFYQIVSEEILKKFGKIYEDKLKLQIWKVVRSLRRIILNSEEISEQFNKLLEINKTLPEQRTPAWYAFRENLITASSWGNVFGWVGSAKEVLLQKLGHEGSQFKGNQFTVWGTKYEPVATFIYEKRTGKKVVDFGCLRHPDENNFFIGASPDGIADDGVMLEIKCPPRREIGPIPTDYYWAQMQGQLEVCDLERCDFLECKILEYLDEEDYLDDIGEDSTKSEGGESGVVLTFKKGEELVYFYSPFFIKGQELIDWIVKHIKENKSMDFCGSSYWKLVKYQCQPVFRDREWFLWAREQLKNFYDQWQFYKKHGYDSLLSERQVKPKSKLNSVENTYLTDYEGFTRVSDTGEETEVLVKKLTKFAFSSSKEEVPEKRIEFVEGVTPKRFGFK